MKCHARKNDSLKLGFNSNLSIGFSTYGKISDEIPQQCCLRLALNQTQANQFGKLKKIKKIIKLPINDKEKWKMIEIVSLCLIVCIEHITWFNQTNGIFLWMIFIIRNNFLSLLLLFHIKFKSWWAPNPLRVPFDEWIETIIATITIIN